MKTGSVSNFLFLPLIAALIPAPSFAQNYVDARNYAIPNVVVDLTVLDNGDYMFGDIMPQRITPSPALRGIRTPNGVISHEGLTTVTDASASMPIPPTIDRVVLKQDLTAPVAYNGNKSDYAPTAEEVADNLSSAAPASIIMQKSEQAAPETKIAMVKPQETKGDEVSSPSEVSVQTAGSVISMVFQAENATLPVDGESSLTKLAESLKSNPGRRIQVKSFASGTPETANRARRLSLTRALNARTFLLQKGVRATQIDVRALGIGNAMENPAKGGAPVDRIDVIVIE